MKRVIILYILFLLSPFAFAQNYKETIQTEIDAINKMPLRIAYLVPLDSLGKVIEDEYMEFDQIHSYKILDDGHIKNANILITMYFDSDNNIRKYYRAPRMLKGRILRHKLEIVPYYAAPTFILYLMEKKLPKEKMA